MVVISKQQQLEERRSRVWELWCEGYSHTEIANNHLHYPRRTITNDVNYMKRKREEERRRKAEQQQHESLEIIEEERTTIKALKKQALSDLNQLSIKEPGQRELRLELYQILGELSDSRIELALVSDRIEEKEALSRMRAKSDNMMLRLGQIEEQTGISSKDNGGLFQEDSQIV